jgi:mannose-1-phosphate guanylyltransferase / mannose-6-phosphate isomerase
MKVIPIIMSGGSGTRLWPLSTADKPKQFHALAGLTETMIAATAQRFTGCEGGLSFLPPVVIGNAAHGDLIARQLADVVPAQAIVLEPMGRNTAATGLLAALIAQQIDPEALVFLAPADHVVNNVGAFRAALAKAAPFARERIVTLGITPTGPETGYGYIHIGDAIGDGVHDIIRFKEKPLMDQAKAMIAEGGHAWNAGMFFFAPDLVIEEFAALPGIAEPVHQALAQGRRDGVFVHLDAQAFGRAKEAPFDIAVMEKTKRGAVAPCSIGWADVGSWPEVWRLGAHGENGNVTQGETALEDCHNCLVIAQGVPVAVAGLSDVVVVATPDGVLVTSKAQAQGVKDLVKALATAKEAANN